MLVEGFCDVNRTIETTFRPGTTHVAVFWLLKGIDICLGTLLPLSLSLKTDQNRLILGCL